MNIEFDRFYLKYLDRVSRWREKYELSCLDNSYEKKRWAKRLITILKTRKRNLEGYAFAYGDRLFVGGRRETAQERRRRIGLKRASQIVRNLVKGGKLPSLKVNYIDCVDCGKRATDYEHRDYNKPKEVEPVCRSCNLWRGSAKYLSVN